MACWLWHRTSMSQRGRDSKSRGETGGIIRLSQSLQLFKREKTCDKLTIPTWTLQFITQLMPNETVPEKQWPFPSTISERANDRHILHWFHWGLNRIEIETPLPKTHPTRMVIQRSHTNLSQFITLHFGVSYLDEHPTDSKLFRNHQLRISS